MERTLMHNSIQIVENDERSLHFWFLHTFFGVCSSLNFSTLVFISGS